MDNKLLSRYFLTLPLSIHYCPFIVDFSFSSITPATLNSKGKLNCSESDEIHVCNRNKIYLSSNKRYLELSNSNQ